jgi:hypothetical protein
MTPPLIRSRKVRRILALEARARRLLTRYERARDKAVRAKTEVHRVLDQAHGIEITLTGGQLGELHRGRGARGQRPAHPAGPDDHANSSTTIPQ